MLILPSPFTSPMLTELQPFEVEVVVSEVVRVVVVVVGG